MEVRANVSFEDTAVAFSYKSDGALKRAHFIFSVVNNPVVASLATGAVKWGLKLGLPIEGLIKRTAFQHFCGGEDIEDCEQVIATLSTYGIGTILDYSVEGEKSEIGFDETEKEILRTLETARSHSSVPFCVFKVTGIGSAELMQKLQSKADLVSDECDAFMRLKERVDAICGKAAEYEVPILIDAEETWIQKVIDELATDMMRKYNKRTAIVFNTYQMYRTESLANLRAAMHDAAMHQYFLGAKLVRGAYMEKERERASELNYESPIHPTKEATDDAFNQALAFCLDNKQRVSAICGSHNEYSNHLLTLLMERHGLRNDDKRFWFSQLYGMSDNISFNLAHAGYNVAKYVPYGPVRSVMPYLFRRAEENTSVAGQSSRELTLIKKELKRRRL